MVLLLNLIAPIIVIVFGYIWWKTRKAWPLVVMVASLLLYVQAQPSYIPKGEVKRTAIAPFEQKDVEIQNRLLTPPSGAEMDRKRGEMIKEGLPFSVDMNNL